MNTKKIANEIFAEVINVKTKPQRPLTPKQEEGLKDVKKEKKMEEHHILENKGRPKVLLSDPKSKNVKLVELDNSGRGREI
jgi:hypothetical protein